MKIAKMWKSQLILSCLALAMLASCCDDEVSLSELKIERTHRAVERPWVFTGKTQWGKLENGLYLAQFYAAMEAPSFYVESPSGAVADPFAAPAESSRKYGRSLTWKDSLEGAGITFGSDASAKYDKKGRILTVIQNSEQMELVEAFFASICIVEEKQVNVRAEIFELPSLQILQLLESSQGEGEHNAERNAVLEAVRKGKARLVAAPSIICRSGQRAKVTSNSQMIIFRKTVEDEGDDEGEKNEVKREELEYGTIFEVDPVLGADDYTIDLNLQLDHDTAPPSTMLGDKRLSDQRLLLHRKSLTLQVTMKDGSSILIGNWKPTGDPRFEKSDLGHVIFITASIQRPGGYERVIEVKE